MSRQGFPAPLSSEGMARREGRGQPRRPRLSGRPHETQPERGQANMPQQSLADFVSDLEKAGLLTRIRDEKRVDELPGVMEAHPGKAVFVERVKDCEFSFLANAYSNHDQYAWALRCQKNELGLKIAELAKGRVKPEVVATAPCKEV